MTSIANEQARIIHKLREVVRQFEEAVPNQEVADIRFKRSPVVNGQQRSVGGSVPVIEVTFRMKGGQ